MENWTTKDWRKVAFAVGFGFYVGKGLSNYVDALLGGFLMGGLKDLAKHGNEIAQETCELAGINYEQPVESKKESEIGS